MNNLQLLYPEIVLGVLSMVLLLADLWIPERLAKFLFHVGILCAVSTLGMIGRSYSAPSIYQGIGTLWIVDPLSLFFKVLVLGATVLVLILSLDYLPEAAPGGKYAPSAAGKDVQPLPAAGGDRNLRHLGSFSALVLISALGMMLLVSASDLLLIFLSIETISISSFILAGYERRNRKSSEGAIKYFLIGAFSAAMMLYGISLFYGATGGTSLLNFTTKNPALLTISLLFILIGFGFKASMAPFHLWVPDAYEGAPTPVTAFLSVAPKVAALAAMLRVFTQLTASSVPMAELFAVLAALTMTVGNFTAIFQTNVKRLLAYSSIAQAGYMLIAFVSTGTMGRDGLLLYSLVYVFMNIGAFTVAIMIGNEDSYELEAYDGLATRAFGVALLMTIFMLSLAGIPPLGGFIAKFYIFAAAMQAHYYWLAVVGVLNSVVSVFYYLRIVYHMFFMPAKKDAPLQAGGYLYGGLAIATAAILVIGLWPDPFIASVRISSEMLPKAASVALLVK